MNKQELIERMAGKTGMAKKGLWYCLGWYAVCNHRGFAKG